MDCIYIHIHYVTLYLELVSSSAEECRTILGGGGRALLGLLPGTLGEIQQAPVHVMHVPIANETRTEMLYMYVAVTSVYLLLLNLILKVPTVS